MPESTIEKIVDRRIGFFRTDSAQSRFVHISALTTRSVALRQGQRVSYADVGHASPRAESVVAI